MYGGVPYAGGGYASAEAGDIPAGQAEPIVAVEVAFTTGALETPVWESVTADVRKWNVSRGRRRELERFQPGRATVVLDNRLRKYDSALGASSQYIDLPGTSGNYVSTPDSTAVSITGDIDLRCKVAMDDWTPAASSALVAKWETTGNQRTIWFAIFTDGRLFVEYSTAGTSGVTTLSTANLSALAAGSTKWVRATVDVDNGASGHDIKFYTSDDGVSWTQLGATVTTAGVISLFDGTATLNVGGRGTGLSPLAGNVYYAEIRNGIDGTVVAKFDANTVPQAGTRTPSSWTSDTGEIWTVNGSAWAWGGSWGTPHAGNIKPMRRIRIRETFNGVTYPTFDGFVDKWILDYSQYGKDATATVTATDLFKIANRTDLPKSVYADEVETDTPELWWRLDDPQFLFAAVDSSGNGHTGTPEGPVRFGGKTLVYNDPGGSLELTENSDTNVQAAFALSEDVPFALEFWFTWEEQPAFVQRLVHADHAGSGDVSFQINNVTSKGTFVFVNNAGGAFQATISTAFVLGTRYHIVCVHDTDRVLDIYVNGTEATYDVHETTTGAMDTDRIGVGQLGSGAAIRGLIDEFAVYTTTLPSATRIAAHYEAGTAPWNGDQPEDRADRVLDINEWPTDLRELDAGNVSLQSAAIDGQTVLEHLQKIAETEFGLLFASRDGKVRLISRANQFARTPDPAILGDADDGVEVPYRDIKFDDGDSVIRNRATISRLNGVARVSESTASVDEYGRFDYSLDGLLHSAEAHSSSYATFIVDEYKNPRRRIVSVDLGPAEADAGVYEQILGRELGDAVTIRNRPLPASSTTFEQVSVIEGVEHDWVPKVRTARWVLSPEFSTSF